MSVAIPFLNALLSGVGCANPKIGAAISFQGPQVGSFSDRWGTYPLYAKNLSDVFPLQGITLSAQGSIKLDTDNYSPDSAAYISCSGVTFPSLGTDYTIPPNQHPWLYTYIDYGTPIKSRVLTYDQLESPAVYGKTLCTFLSGRVLSLTDGSDSGTGLYRNFRFNLLKGTYGNLLTANWCAALVLSGYTPDLAHHTTYANISSYVTALTSIQQKDFIIQYGGFWKNVNYVSFGVVPASADRQRVPITSIVGFISGTSAATSPLAFVYSNLNVNTLVPTNNVIQWNINDSILFSLA